MAFLSEAVVVGGQLEKFDLSNNLKFLQKPKRNKKSSHSKILFNLSEALKQEKQMYLSPLLKVNQTTLKKTTTKTKTGELKHQQHQKMKQEFKIILVPFFHPATMTYSFSFHKNMP